MTDLAYVTKNQQGDKVMVGMGFWNTQPNFHRCIIPADGSQIDITKEVNDAYLTVNIRGSIISSKQNKIILSNAVVPPGTFKIAIFEINTQKNTPVIKSRLVFASSSEGVAEGRGLFYLTDEGVAVFTNRDTKLTI
jgi:hypothetical protein